MTKIYVNDKGFKVQPIGDMDGETISFAPQGGGFGYKLPRKQFFEEFKPYSLPQYTARRATFEFFEEGVTLAAWSNDLRWNGWAMPYFSYEQGLEAQKLFPELRFDAARDAFVWTCEGLDGEEVYPAETIETDAGLQKLYGIGTGSWTWEWAEED